MPEEVAVVRFGHDRDIVFEIVKMSVFVHTYRDGRDFRWVKEDNQYFPVVELGAAAGMHQPIISTAMSRDFMHVFWKALHREPYEAVSFKAEATPSQMKLVRWPRKEDQGNFVMLTAGLTIPQWKRIVGTSKLTSASIEELKTLMQEWADKHGIRL